MRKKTLEAICSEIQVWDEWKDNYAKYVPLFIAEASKGISWQEWSPEVFNEYFTKSMQQCVSSLRQGYFTNAEKEEIKTHWDEIAPVLQKIALSQDQPSFELYNELKDIIRKYTKSDRRSATYRLIAGLQPQLLCTIVNDRRMAQLIELLQANALDFNFDWKSTWFENSYQILQLFKQATRFDDGYQVMTLPWQVYEEYDFTKSNQDKTNDMSEDKVDEVIALLEYKKQIILQGPPGTGKTRMAKEIAAKLTGTGSLAILTTEEIKEHCRDVTSIPTAKTKLYFKILGINGNGVRVENSEGTENVAPFPEVIRMYESQAWTKAGLIVNGTHSYSAAVAKFLYSKRGQFSKTSATGNCKIIQFHPSYNYEDFVRGIVAKPNEDGDGIMYEAENKILGSFAAKAWVNYQESLAIPTANIDLDHFNAFVSEVLTKIDEEEKYTISDKVYIYFADDKRFKYKGDNWTAHPKGLNMNYDELRKIIALNLTTRQEINKNEALSALTRQHATYYQNVVELYKKFASLQAQQVDKKVALNKYVLIIDEINRANLSSVLGELIYALEYRSEEVESMYAVNESNKLILPPNLYIIGTMNTADRSVGHIDYAVRRRFAFVDVLPEALAENEKIYFNAGGFEKVSALFTSENVSPEFEVKDVQIGHSYFIAEKKDTTPEMKDAIFKLKMEFEVVPILKEYVKDGILLGRIKGQDVKEYIDSLKEHRP